MTEATAPTLEPGLVGLVPRGGLILAETDTGREERYRAVRQAAVGLAASTGADVLFFDRSAASLVSDPYPSGRYTADVDGTHGERALVAGELGALGRSYLADQINDAQRQGVLAMAWLPRKRGAAGLADAVDRTGAHLVLLASSVEHPSLGERLLGHNLRSYLSRLESPVAVVEPEGRIRLVSQDAGTELTPSRISFMAELSLQRVRGTFRHFAVRVRLDPESATGGTVQANIEAASLNTGLGPRDANLRSGMFLDVATYPQLTFQSRSIKRDGDVITVEGDLGVHGQQRPVTLFGTVHELGTTEDGRRRVRVRASTEIHWRKWGVRGIPLIGDVLAVTLDIEGLETTAGGGHFHARGQDKARTRRVSTEAEVEPVARPA
jgi:polyisoprenoid-binding protein YceI